MPGVVETSRTRNISLRVPKDLLKAIDSLVKAGFFKSRTEFTIAAYSDFLDKFAKTGKAYLIAKKKVGAPTQDNLSQFIDAYLNAIESLIIDEVKKTPLEQSTWMMLLLMFSSADRKESLSKTLESLGVAVEENKEKQTETAVGGVPNARRTSPPENSGGGDLNVPQ